MTITALALAADVTRRVAAALEAHAREAELSRRAGAEETRDLHRQLASVSAALRAEADRAARHTEQDRAAALAAP